MNDISRKKILIGSCGGLTGIYLSKYFATSGNYILYGFDSTELSAGRLFSEKCFQLPPSNDIRFLDELIQLINSEDISYYLPTHSKEIRIISKFEKTLRNRTDVKFLVSPYETFLALESKEQAYYSLSEAQIPTPRLITGIPSSFPVIMKGHFGSGGSSVQHINNSKVFEAYRDTTNDVSFFEQIKGKEYTVDCIFDNCGVLLGFNMRERIKSIGGAVVISKNAHDFDILPWLRQLEKHWQFRGCVNFQVIVQDNIPYFIDINLRYPSGGLPLTVKSGLNIPEMMIRIMEGNAITYGEYCVDPSVCTMYRYYEEIFVYDIT